MFSVAGTLRARPDRLDLTDKSLCSEPQSTNYIETHKNGRFVSLPNSLARAFNMAGTKGMRRIGLTFIKLCGIKNGRLDRGETWVED